MWYDIIQRPHLVIGGKTNGRALSLAGKQQPRFVIGVTPFLSLQSKAALMKDFSSSPSLPSDDVDQTINDVRHKVRIPSSTHWGRGWEIVYCSSPCSVVFVGDGGGSG